MQTTLTTPSGTPASSSSSADRQRRRSGVSCGRLEHHRAARGERRADLARGHGGREVPRRDQQRDARSAACATSIRFAPLGAVAKSPLRAHGLLGEPAQELGRIGRLAARLGERLAHLAHDQLRRSRRCARPSGRTRDAAISARSRGARAAQSSAAAGRGVHRGDPVVRRGGFGSTRRPIRRRDRARRTARRSVAMTMAGQ